MDDFDEYPIILCRYTDKKNKSQIMSGTRGDGLCSIWSVLLGWSLLGRSDFIRNKLSNELTFPINKYTIKIVINLIKKNLGVIIAMIHMTESEAKKTDIKKEINYVPVSVLFNGNFGDQVFTKEECAHTIMQLQKWTTLSTINGSAHLLILAILLGINIKVRDVSDSNDIRIFSYGNNNNTIVRITTNGSHYNVHNTQKNKTLPHDLKDSHWWKNQWITGSEGKHKQINFNEPILPSVMYYHEIYGPVNKAGKKKPKKGTSIRRKDRKSKDDIRSRTPSKMPKVKTTPEERKIATAIMEGDGIRVGAVPGKKADDTTGMRIYQDGETPEWAKKQKRSAAAKKIQGLARMKKANKTVKLMKQKEKSRQTRKKNPSIRVGATTPQWYKDQQNAAANKMQKLFRKKRAQKVGKKTKLPSLGIRVSSKPYSPKNTNRIKAKPPPIPAIPGQSFLKEKRRAMLESDKGKKYTALAKKIAETRRGMAKIAKQGVKQQPISMNRRRAGPFPQRPFPPRLKGEKPPPPPAQYKRKGRNLTVKTNFSTDSFSGDLSATSSDSSGYESSSSRSESSGEGKRKRTKKGKRKRTKKGKKGKKGGTRKVKRKCKTKKMLCFRGSKKKLKKFGKKSKKAKVKFTRCSRKRFKIF